MYCKDHYRFLEAFKDRAGQEFKTEQIIDIMWRKFRQISGCVKPNDHCEVHKGACKCASTEERIFDKIRHALYRVRPNL